jgi:plastocyanin
VSLNQDAPAFVLTGMKAYVLAAGAAVTILLAACSSTSTPAGTASSAGAAATAKTGSSAAGGIVISSFAYSGTMTVKPGEKVTVTNQDSVAHTLTDKVSHLFDTGNIGGSGGTGAFTAPTKPGSYPFGCTYHPNMKGTLIVAG